MSCIQRFFIFCSIIPMFLLPKDYYTGKELVTVTGQVESKNSFISYVIINGLRFIVKQKKDVSKLTSAIREALAAYIAQDLGISQSVQIIAVEQHIPGKINADSPATLHSLAAGKTVRSQKDSKYSLLCLKQRSPEDRFIKGRWLTEEIIDQITWHKQLPIVIALDLFISNTDRHGGNLFYDEATDCFCVIDMDNIFRWDLCNIACQKLDIMVNVNKKQFTRQEIEALIQVRNTLIFLASKYTPQHIIRKLDLFVKQVGGRKIASVDKQKMAIKVKNHKKMIIQSRKSVYKLIDVLDKIIIDSPYQL